MQYKLLLILATCVVFVHARADEGTFDSKGVKIRYVTEGKGEAVVLIHGWMSDLTMWGPKLKPPDGFQLIALDCRGHGKSDKPHDPARYGVEMAADIVRLLDHLKIKKAHLVGYSMGAIIAGKVAAMYPTRVRSVVYGGQAPLVAGLGGPSSAEVDAFAKAVDDGKLGDYILHVTQPGKPVPTPEQAEVMAKMMFNGKDVKAFAAAGRSFPRLEVRPAELKRCKAPFLFIHGSLEAESTRSRAAAIVKLLGRGEVKVVVGADHIGTLTRPEFGVAVVEFLRAHRGK